MKVNDNINYLLIRYEHKKHQIRELKRIILFETILILILILIILL